MSDLGKRIVEFLIGIGLVVREAEASDDSFLPGVRICGGELLVDWTRLKWPGDLLHEAGHIATVPASLRRQLSDALEGQPGSIDVGEAEATAWAYAACVELGIDPLVLFHSGGYQGHSEGLISTFGFGVYPGSAGLARVGMTHVGKAALEMGLPCYPAMTRWLRP